MKFVLFAVLCIAAVASAHTCLLNPLQRTPISNMGKVEAPECGLMTGPCGGTSQGTPEIAYQGGETIGLVFQKNLNHWKDSYPQGGFTVAWAPKDDASSWNTLSTSRTPTPPPSPSTPGRPPSPPSPRTRRSSSVSSTTSPLASSTSAPMSSSPPPTDQIQSRSRSDIR